jgi:hypothetical protein
LITLAIARGSLDQPIWGRIQPCLATNFPIQLSYNIP